MEPIEEGTMERIVAASEERLVQLCAISSESGNAAGIRSVAEQLRPALERHGLRVDIADEPDAAGKPQPAARS